MLAVLSPSKTLDCSPSWPSVKVKSPHFLSDTRHLVSLLRDYSEKRLQSLMGISPKLAQLNAMRYRQFATPFTDQNAKPAIFAFKGDVYEGLDIETCSAKSLHYLQSHVRILSGLYGLLEPFDLMQPYRLEMGVTLANDHGKNLYAFWGDKITNRLNDELKSSQKPVLINLASEEYFKSIRPDRLQGTIITPQFKEKKNGSYKTIGLFAKRARGMMIRYMADNTLTKIDNLKLFDKEGYRFMPKFSDSSNWVFAR